MGKLKLNLGSGTAHPLPGYENLDIRTGQAIYPLPYESETVDEVRASHVLEHFGHTEAGAVLLEWVRVLKPGGILKLAVPDFEKLARMYLGEWDPPEGSEFDASSLESYIMGGWSNEHDRHGSLYNEDAVRDVFQSLGFTDIEEWEGDPLDCSGLPISLNIQGRKGQEVDPTAPPDTSALDVAWLRGRASNRYSQFGEDGIVQAIFERIGPKHAYVCECGAGDGQTFSVARTLIEGGWGGCLIEKDPDKFRKLERLYDGHKGRMVSLWRREAAPDGENSLDNLLEECDAPGDLDLLVIDVDGQDYYLLNGLLRHAPRVIVCEFDYLQEDQEFIPLRGGDGQAGIEQIAYLGYLRSYTTVAQTHCNAIMVRNELVPLLHGEEPGGAPPDEGAKLHPAVIVSEPEQIPRTVLANIAGKVTAIMTTPSLTFTEQAISACSTLAPLNIDLRYSTGVFWGQCLTRVMKDMIAQGWEYLLTIDYDTVYKARDVLELYRLMEKYPEIDALVPVQMKRGTSKLPLFSMSNPDGSTKSEITGADLKPEVAPIRAGHFGLTLLRSSAFAAMPHPWFVPVPDPETQEWDANRVDEDVNFWLQWRGCGNIVCLAPRVVVGHLERVVTWPDRRLRPFYQHERSWQTEGKPKAAWR